MPVDNKTHGHGGNGVARHHLHRSVSASALPLVTKAPLQVATSSHVGLPPTSTSSSSSSSSKLVAHRRRSAPGRSQQQPLQQQQRRRSSVYTYANMVDSAHRKNISMSRRDENDLTLASSTMQRLLWVKLQGIFDGDVTPEQLRLIRAPVLSPDELHGDLHLYATSSSSSSSSNCSSASSSRQTTPAHSDDEAGAP